VKAKVRNNCSIIFNSINENSEVLEPIRRQLKCGFVISEYENVVKVNHLLMQDRVNKFNFFYNLECVVNGF
jgi:hypothetical protein